MLLKMGIQFIFLRHFKRYETILKLQGLAIFDSSHLIALLVSFVFIFFLPYLGKILTKEQKKIIVFGIIVFAIVQEIIDYANRSIVRDLSWDMDLPLHVCHYVLISAIIGIWRKNQTAFEIGYLLGITGGLQAMLTPDMTDFDNWTAYTTFYMHHSLILICSFWSILVDGMKPRSIAVQRSFLFLFIMAIPVGIICWITGGNYMYLREMPSVNNPLVFGQWPWYIINLGFIGLLLMIFAYLPFFAINRWKLIDDIS